MKLDDVISDIDRNILFQERHIESLKSEKLKFEKIKLQHPGAQFEGRSICLPDIWGSITCMRIERKRKYYSASQINVKFLLGKKHSLEGMKIYTLPFENEVAEIRHTYGITRKKEILIRDYKSLVPMDCPKRNSFIKRIKLYLVDSIMKDGLTIDPKSFDKDEFIKLMLLK